MSFGKGCHLHLIDGSAFIFRAYHALPPLTRKSDGLPVGAVAGFCNLLWGQLQANKGKDALVPQAPLDGAIASWLEAVRRQEDYAIRRRVARSRHPDCRRPRQLNAAARPAQAARLIAPSCASAPPGRSGSSGSTSWSWS